MNRQPPTGRHRSLGDWLQHIQTVHFRSIDMGLERVRAVLERLVDRPSFGIIAVAGTNGKGSCAAMLGSILRAAGHRVGVYTSPHLVRFNERIRIGGRPAGDSALCRAFAAIEAARGDIPLTYFEFATLAAVQLYQDAAVDYAVMEVGMGGRLDAVNALPIDAALITNIAIDHVHWLGRDREAIGGEKAPVMRPARPAVFNHDDPPRSVLAHAEAIQADLLVAGRDYHYEHTGGTWRWTGPRGEAWSLELPAIPGAVQVENASGVLALLSSLPETGIDRETVATGLKNVRVQGRGDIVARAPMVIVDVAHNLAAIATLAACLDSNPVSGRTRAVFGMLKDKDPTGIATAMDSRVDAWHLAGIDDERGQDSETLAPSLANVVRGAVHCHPSAVAAFEHARGQSGRDDRIVVFGSFHIAGDILEYMKRQS